MSFSHETIYFPPSNVTHPDPEFARLRQLAAARSIPNYATMRKEELKQALVAVNRISAEG